MRCHRGWVTRALPPEVGHCDRDGENGCGMVFKTRAIQVVDLIPYEQVDPTDSFNARDGYCTGTALYLSAS